MEKIFTLGESRRNRRKSLGITQKQMAAICEISERQYIRYENGDQEPGVRIALKIAKALDSTVEELFPGEV